MASTGNYVMENSCCSMGHVPANGISISCDASVAANPIHQELQLTACGRVISDS